ncbi:cytochrome b pre-mRNA-processing protein 6, partial [Lecanoromycetidae sp. Uapishka_2]
MAKAIVQKHYLRIMNNWPADLLRPEVSFQKTIQKRIDTRLKASTTPTQDNVVSNQALASVPTAVPFDEKGELEQVNVLYSFLENRYTKKYPLSERMMKPVSNPEYYVNLMKELNEAPNRSWFNSVIARWKGFLRFS